MRVLLLNLYFPPDTSATAKMARSVVDALSIAHNVTVLCGRPSYDPAERRAWRPYRTEFAGRTRIIRAGSTDFPRFDMKKRVVNYLSYVGLAIPRALFAPCDVVVAMTDPPFQGIVGAIVAMLKRKPYVYNIRDLYPDMAVGGSIVKPGLPACTRTNEKFPRIARTTSGSGTGSGVFDGRISAPSRTISTRAGSTSLATMRTRMSSPRTMTRVARRSVQR